MKNTNIKRAINRGLRGKPLHLRGRAVELAHAHAGLYAQGRPVSRVCEYFVWRSEVPNGWIAVPHLMGYVAVNVEAFK